MTFISSHILLNVLAGLMLGSSVILLGRMRLVPFVRLFAAQSLLLSIIAIVSGLEIKDGWHLFVAAALTFAIKVCFVPYLLVRIARKSGATERLQSYLRPAPALLAGIILACLAFWLTKTSLISFAENTFIVAAALTVILLGFLMLIVRRDMYSQLIAFLLMENGIFTFGLALTGGMPLLVELGIFFDVTVGVILMAALSHNAQKQFESVDTKTLGTLIE